MQSPWTPSWVYPPWNPTGQLWSIPEPARTAVFPLGQFVQQAWHLPDPDRTVVFPVDLDSKFKNEQGQEAQSKSDSMSSKDSAKASGHGKETPVSPQFSPLSPAAKDLAMSSRPASSIGLPTRPCVKLSFGSSPPHGDGQPTFSAMGILNEAMKKIHQDFEGSDSRHEDDVGTTAEPRTLSPIRAHCGPAGA
ncbi:hypothetical protein KCU83_g3793, partial [Aureobasidium melanogenum]